MTGFVWIWLAAVGAMLYSVVTVLPKLWYGEELNWSERMVLSLAMLGAVAMCFARLWVEWFPG